MTIAFEIANPLVLKPRLWRGDKGVRIVWLWFGFSVLKGELHDFCSNWDNSKELQPPPGAKLVW